MHYSIICFKNQAMFALIKKDCYYGVTTDLIFVLLDNKTKKSRNRCISTASRLFLWSEWRDLNSRPLDPQSSALPAAPHPVVPKFSLLPASRLSAFANRRGASFRNIVAVLRLERSFRSLFLHLEAMPSSATGGGISPRPAAPHPESSSIIPQEKRFDKSFSKLF